MLILENNDILNLRKKLFETIKQSNIVHFHEKFYENKNKAAYWKFATDEMFMPIPFYHELHKLKKGRILKFNSIDEAFDKNNNYTDHTHAFGFSRDGSLLIMMRKSLGYINGIDCTVYDNINNAIEYFHFVTFSNDSSKDKLMSVNTLTGIDDNFQYDVGVGSNRFNWTATAYKYKEDLVDKVFVYSEGWKAQVEYNFEYEKDTLKKIKIGTVDWWKKK